MKRLLLGITLALMGYAAPAASQTLAPEARMIRNLTVVTAGCSEPMRLDRCAVLDMPGMGELQLTRALEGITDAFADVSASAGQCRYNTASLGDRKSGGKPCTRQSGRSRSRTGSRT